MSKYQIKEDVKYYKSMTLTSSGLIVELQEKADYSYKRSDGTIAKNIKPAHVNIFHSPGRFELEHRWITLKSRQDLKDYIAMLTDFDERYGEYIEDVVQ